VSAGIVIAEEAGGLVTGSHDVFAATSSSNKFGDVTEDILTGRKYVVVRAIAPNPVRFSSVYRNGTDRKGLYSQKLVSRHRRGLSKSFTTALKMLQQTNGMLEVCLD
jgi:hypothetical protein